MLTFEEWLKKVEEAGCGVPYVGQSPGKAAGGWQGAPSGGKLTSVGDVKPKTKKKKN